MSLFIHVLSLSLSLSLFVSCVTMHIFIFSVLISNICTLYRFILINRNVKELESALHVIDRSYLFALSYRNMARHDSHLDFTPRENRALGTCAIKWKVSAHNRMRVCSDWPCLSVQIKKHWYSRLHHVTTMALIRLHTVGIRSESPVAYNVICVLYQQTHESVPSDMYGHHTLRANCAFIVHSWKHWIINHPQST